MLETRITPKFPGMILVSPSLSRLRKSRLVRIECMETYSRRRGSDQDSRAVLREASAAQRKKTEKTNVFTPHFTSFLSLAATKVVSLPLHYRTHSLHLSLCCAGNRLFVTLTALFPFTTCPFSDFFHSFIRQPNRKHSRLFSHHPSSVVVVSPRIKT